MYSLQHGLGIGGAGSAYENDFLGFVQIKIQGNEQTTKAKRLLLHMPPKELQDLLGMLEIGRLARIVIQTQEILGGHCSA